MKKSIEIFNDDLSQVDYYKYQYDVDKCKDIGLNVTD